MKDTPLIFTNKIQKYIRSLSSAKYRKKYNRYIIEGDKICKLFIEICSEQIEYVLATSAWTNVHADLIQKMSNQIIRIDENEIKSISLLKTASDILIIAKKNICDLKKSLKSDFQAVYLDDVQDPGNVGTIIRTASWFGFDAVIRSKGSADFYNSKVLQSTMGGHLYLSLIEADIAEVKSTVNDLVIFGTAMTGVSYLKISEFPKRKLIVIGNEGKGMQLSTREFVDEFVTIPGKENIESLNAAVAFGIVASRFHS